MDYTKVKKLQIPEGYEEGNIEDEQAEDPEERKTRNELIYIAGRMYCEVCKKTGNKKWIYEKYNQIVESNKYPNGVPQALCDLYKHSVEECAGYEE